LGLYLPPGTVCFVSPPAGTTRFFSIASLVCQESFVKFRLASNPQAWPALLALLLPMGPSLAQTPARPAATTAPAAGAATRSALEGYQPYTDEKTVDWKAANDSVGRIGGWRAYAREAAQPGPQAPAAPAAATSDPHAGHHQP
jgi:hypothetical protein